MATKTEEQLEKLLNLHKCWSCQVTILLQTKMITSVLKALKMKLDPQIMMEIIATKRLIETTSDTVETTDVSSSNLNLKFGIASGFSAIQAECNLCGLKKLAFPATDYNLKHPSIVKRIPRSQLAPKVYQDRNSIERKSRV
uniref:Uncharacterized protein n=1 Tax=Glossina austeni TaxID=7395 RepID=A0A1A9VH64_GLOAU